jgi:hypothetical protein
MRTTTGNPHGSILPKFYFTKLMPIPFLKNWGGTYEIPLSVLQDETAMQREASDPSKTIINSEYFQYAELVMRAICEGFIDSERAANCTDPFIGYSNAWDYTWENLWFDATGGNKKWWTTFPTGSIRTDAPIGYGTPPNTRVYAEIINDYGAAINLLHRVRMPLPFKLLCNTKDYYGIKTVTLDWPEGTEGGCCENCSYFRYVALGESPVAATTPQEYNTDDYYECGGCGAYVSTNWANPGGCDPSGNFYLFSNRTVCKYKFEPLDSDAYYAMNQDLRDLYNAEDNGFFAQVDYQYSHPNAFLAEHLNGQGAECITAGDHPDGPAPHWFDWETGKDWAIEDPNYRSETYCTVLNDGTLDAGTTPPGPVDILYGANICPSAGSGRCFCSYGHSSIYLGITALSTEENILNIPIV